MATSNYDQYGNKTREIDPLGHTTVYTYDMLGRVTAQTDPLQHTTRYDYDGLSHVTVITNALGFATHYEYDANGNRSAEIDALGRRTTYVYDGADRQIEVHFPNATAITTTYDFRNQPLSKTDQTGHVTRYTYDKAGQLRTTTLAQGTADAGTITIDYDTAGRKVRETDPLSATTTYGYDDANRLTSVTDARSYPTTYHYDAAGRRDWVKDAKNHTTSNVYDARGRLRETHYPDGTVSYKTYDSANNPATDVDQAHKTTIYQYNANHQLLSVRNPLLQTTSYEYDAGGMLRKITDANNHSTTFEYNAVGQLKKKTWADTTTYEQFDYNEVGNQLSHRLADGNSNTFEYDELNRLKAAHYFDATNVIYAYTPTGQRKTVTDARGVTSYGYDARDRLTTITTPNNQTLTYTYDPGDNRKSLITPAATTTYDYNANHQLTRVADAEIGTTNYTYDEVGSRLSRTLPNGVVTNYGYDTLNRLTSVVQQKGATTLASYTYTLGQAGNRTQVTQADGTSIVWDYNDAYRLTGETFKNASGGVIGQATYDYDPVGNRLKQTVQGQTTTYTYNALDELTLAGSASYTYDGRGNLRTITDGTNTTNYTWDAQDRLTSATTPTGGASYTYDADGRRVRQIAGGTTTNELWDEASTYGDVVLESDGNGATTARYVLGGTELLAQSRGGTISYYGQDGQGSVRTLTNASGSVTDRYDYTAFGELQGTSSGSSTNSYRYTGQQFDSITGLYSLRARYYQPGLGRFLSRDSVAVNAESPRELMRYGYVAGNPVNAFDPSGQLLFEYRAISEAVSQNAQNVLNGLGLAIEHLYGWIGAGFLSIEQDESSKGQWESGRSDTAELNFHTQERVRLGLVLRSTKQ